MKITDLKEAISTVTTEISGWTEEQTLEVTLKKPQLYTMLVSGNIPNPLIDVVEKLFVAAYRPQDDNQRVLEARGLMEIARVALVKPTLAEIEEAGLQLTDSQLLEIYAFALSGVNGLKTFRKRADGRDLRDVAGTEGKAE